MPVLALIFLSFTFSHAQDSTDSLLPYKPYRLHSFGVHVRAKYAYLLEYNFRTWPHLELKIEGGTADHTHFDLMGFSTTQTTGRYIGAGFSYVSNNYFEPKKSYKLQHGFIVGAGYGIGQMNFSGEHMIQGTYYDSREINVTEEHIRYSYVEARLGYEFVIDRVVRFDIYPIQFTFHNILSNTKLQHHYIPAIGVTRGGSFNPGLGIHANINQLIRKKDK